MTTNVLDGFDKTEGIVGFHYDDRNVFLYKSDGSKETRPLRLFSLANRGGLYNVGGKLKGGLHWQYAYTFSFLPSWRKFNMENRDYVKTWQDPIQNIMMSNGMRMYRGLALTDLCVLSWDIETTGLDRFADDAQVILITSTARLADGTIKRALFAVTDYEHTGQMIDNWCRWVCEVNPDIILGHNIFGYDFPYMEAIANRYGTSLRIGRVGMSMTFEKFPKKFRLTQGRNLEFNMPIIPGREVVDTMLLAYKSDIGSKYESYGLKQLIKAEGLEQPDRQFYDARLIGKNYKKPEEMVKIKAYAERDADDGLALFDKFSKTFFQNTKFLPQTFQSICVSASGGQIDNLLVSSYLCQGYSIPLTSKKKKFQGALSNGWPGIYHNVFKVDVAALYPSIIISFSVFDKKKDPLGLALEFTKTFKEKRLEYKKAYKETGDEKWDELDKVAKGTVNSFYGFFGTEGLCFNSPDCAEFITAKGREILETSIVWATGRSYESWVDQK